MPWCEPCAKYFTPSAMNDDGTCPQCGTPIEDHGRAPERSPEGAADDESTPWHFKLLVVTLVIYLGWRFFQLLF